MPGPYPCCGNAASATPCTNCNTDETPSQVEIVVTGFTNDQCTDAANINRTLTLNQTINPCVYDGTVVGGSDWQGVFCASQSIVYTVLINASTVNVTIDIGHDDYTYQGTPISSGDCCTDLTTATSIPFQSQTTGGSDFGHDGSGSTVTVRCIP